MKTKQTSSFSYDRAMEIAVAATSHKFPQLTKLRSPTAQSHRLTAKTDGFAMALLDITLDTEGEIRLIEANGSNAALSSLTATGDDARATHMFAALTARFSGEGKGVALLGHQAGFLHIPEFFGRAERFRQLASSTFDSVMRTPEEEPGDEVLTIVAGDLGSIARHCSEVDGNLYYLGRPVVFATNTNLVPELARQGRLSYQAGHTTTLSTGFFHEGQLAPLIHDKAAQQRMAEGTGIMPLTTAEAHSREECLSEIRRLRDGGRPLVLKMNGGSGGAGIEFIPPWFAEQEICEQWDALVASAIAKYGRDVEKTLYPVRIFEFTQSTGFQIEDAHHLWDLRVQCLISPGFIDVAPAVIRLCPEPFEERVFSRNSVVSNLTGREASLLFMRSPWEPADKTSATNMEHCGFTPDIYQRLLHASVAWCENAMTNGAGIAPEVSRS